MILCLKNLFFHNLLIISNELRKDYFKLTDIEKSHLCEMIDVAKKIIEQDYKPDGYNIGMNCGKDAGQTIFHFHCHVMPRYKDDFKYTMGGIRYVKN